MADPKHAETSLPDLREIERVLPHRYPFLLLDRVLEFVPGERIVGLKQLTANEATTEGAPPCMAVVPGGLLIEAVTQLGAVLVLHRPEMAGKVALILQIPSARMLKPVPLGSTLRLEAQVLRLKQTLGELRGAAYLEGELVAEGRMRFAIVNAGDLLSQRVNS